MNRNKCSSVKVLLVLSATLYWVLWTEVIDCPISKNLQAPQRKTLNITWIIHSGFECYL